MTAAVRMRGVHRSYGAVRALDAFDLDVAPGELVVLLGPSGCGKTTALRALAGLEDVDGGTVEVAGRDLSGVPASKRDMGMVFQAYSLFPHMTARENVAFGLRMRGVGSAERRRRADQALELVHLQEQADRYAHQMSGGQQQRVALARALAIEPSVLLLDEPLSALDAQVRTTLREEIRRVQLDVGTTTLFVTHDQEEALAVADRVGVMNGGRIEQIGPPEEVYARPATPFVAGFVGLTNRVPAEVLDGHAHLLGTRLPLVDPGQPAGAATAFVRPEDVVLEPDAAGPATVVTTSFLGALRRTTAVLDDGTRLLAQRGAADGTDVRPGDRVAVRVRPVPVVAGPAT